MIDPIRFVESFNVPKMGLSTGLKSLDNAILGFQPGYYYVIGAISSHGKSSIIGTMALQTSLVVPTGLISIEMNQELTVNRMIFSLAGLNFHKGNAGKLDSFEKEELKRAVEAYNTRQLFINDETSLFYPDWLEEKWAKGTEDAPSSSIEALCRKWIDQGVKIIFLDYLQLADLAEKKERDDLKIKTMSRKLRLLANKYKVSIVTAVQLDKSVENRQDATPTVNDLWGSSFIRNDSDIIVLLYRPELRQKTKGFDLFNNCSEEAQIIIGKNRSGPTGTIRIGYEPFCFRYKDIEVEDDSSF